MKEQALFVTLIFSFCLTVENCSICCGDDLHFHGLLSQSTLSLSLSQSLALDPNISPLLSHQSKADGQSCKKKKIQNEKAHSALQI